MLVEVLIEHLRRQAITSANRAQAIQITTITDLKSLLSHYSQIITIIIIIIILYYVVFFQIK